MMRLVSYCARSACITGEWPTVRVFSRLDTNPALTYVFAQGKGKSQAPAYSKRFPLWRYPMPLSRTTLSLVASPVTLQEGLKILERDVYCCPYCGLYGLASV